MTQPYLGEIRMLSFNFAPKGFAMCNGQTLSIQQNAALFSILGTTFGGNGVQTFALPNMQSRVPIHFGQALGGHSYILGKQAGEENHALLSNEIPPHSHFARASNDGSDSNTPATTILAQSKSFNLYTTATSSGTTTIAPTTIGAAGQNIPHNNLQPYLVINFCIALVGVFPSRN